MNKRKNRHWGFAFLFLMSTFYGTLENSPCFGGEPTLIKIGWQTSWATQGQIAMVLKKTNILELNGLKGEFKGFTYGGPLNEGALAGAVEVIFTADQPACMLLARGAKWKIISRLIYNRVGTIVPVDSNIHSIADLKGKTIGIPFGAAAQRQTLKALKAAGLDPVKDVTCLNIGIYEQINVIQKGNNKYWPGVDAFSTWDPPLAELELNHKIRILDQGLVTAVVVMSEDFITKHPEAAINFIKSYITACYYYATHRQEADEWFKQEAKLDFDAAVLDLAASVEPNLKATGLDKVNISLSDEDILTIQSGADFIYDQKLTDRHIRDVRDHINLDFLKKAVNDLSSSPAEYLSRIKLKENK